MIKNCSIGSIDISVVDNKVVKMKEKDAFKYSLKCSEKVWTLPTKTSVKLSRNGEATFVSEGHILANSCNISFNDCMKDMNVEYIPQPCLNQQFKCKKQKSHHQLKPLLILFLMHL